MVHEGGGGGGGIFNEWFCSGVGGEEKGKRGTNKATLRHQKKLMKNYFFTAFHPYLTIPMIHVNKASQNS